MKRLVSGLLFLPLLASTPALAERWSRDGIDVHPLSPPPREQTVEELELQERLPFRERSHPLPESIYTSGIEPVLEPTEHTGILYATGGVGMEEIEALKSNEDLFNVKIVSSMKSGEFLSGTQISIYDASSALVFEAPMAGPYLYVKLPEGEYRLEARQYQALQEKNIKAGRDLRKFNFMW